MHNISQLYLKLYRSIPDSSTYILSLRDYELRVEIVMQKEFMDGR